MTVESLSASTVRPEAELLFYCARSGANPEVSERIGTLVQGEVDWEHLLRLAGSHGVTPLLYRALDNACPEAVPRAIMDHLRSRFRANGRRNLFLTGELLGLLEAMNAHAIPAVPYKGPILAVRAYGNIALREFGDLDVLIHKSDIPRARDVMESLGYRQLEELSGAQEEAFLRSQCEYLFTNGNGTVVELHWALVPRKISFSLDTEDLWTRLGETRLGGATVPTFSPEDTLLILCVHGSKHRWKRLGWVCDVAGTIDAHPGMDIDRVMAQASALGVGRMLFMGLFLANDLLGTALPGHVLERVRADKVVGPLAGRVTELMILEDNGPQGFLEESSFRPLYLGMRERLADRLRYCVHTAMSQTAEDWELVPLPRYFFPLYYLLRLVRLTGKHGKRLLERALIRLRSLGR